MRLIPDDLQVERLRELVAERLGLHLENVPVDSVANVLQARLDATRLSAEAYLSQLEGGDSARRELEALGEALTVPETYFLRNAEQFTVLLKVIATRWAQRGGLQPLRVLCAGCATGEEAYSIAIGLREAFPDLAPTRVDIRAVDIAPAAIARARRGRFSAWSMRETPDHIRGKWFEAVGRDFVLADEIRSMVTLCEANLAEDDPGLWIPGWYDVIFCRNVLMYFTLNQARLVVKRIQRSLAPEGYLFLGYAETLRGLSQDFHLRHTHGAFYYQSRSSCESLVAKSPRRETPRSTGPMSSDAIVDACGLSWVESIGRATQRVDALLNEHCVSAVVAAKRLPSPGTHLAPAMDLLRQERFTDALAALHELPEGVAQSTDVLLLRAALLAHEGNLHEAERAAQALLEVDELSAGAHYVLALCREGFGDVDGAREHDQYAVYLEPNFSMPRLHLGLLARRRRDHRAASRELSQALALIQREDPSRLLLFGGGFGRDMLLQICRRELLCCGEVS